MDELDALRGMRTNLAREESADRLALRTNWRSGRAPSRPRRRMGLKVPMVSMLATATVAAGSVAVVSMGSDGGAGGSPITTGPVRGNALLVAATNAEKSPGGKYWHTSVIDGRFYAVGKTTANHYRVESRERYESWHGQDGGACYGQAELPGRPVTAEDKRKWQQAGSPMEVQLPIGEGSQLGVVFMKAPQPDPTRCAGRQTNWNDGERFFGLTPQKMAALPAEPKALENALLDLKGHWVAYSPTYSQSEKEKPMRTLRGEARVRALSEVAGTLLGAAPASPKVRAAAYRMLAALPGVKAEGQAADPLGRTGTVISLPVETTMPLGLYSAPQQLGTYRRQWIINPANGTLLALRDLVVKPPHGSRKLPPGDDGKPRSLQVKDMPDRFHKPGEVVSYEVYEAAEWTDTLPN